MADRLDLGRRFTRNPAVVARKIAGEFLLVPLKRKPGDADHIYSLNEVAGRVWELVDGTRTVGDILKCVLEEYEVDPAEAEADLVALLMDLEKLDAVKGV